ncbi:predicted protein [Sclerotinia sclerotiorum 1980 UF-70]|uniref:Uncharacterized protein n=1 Tax=Sclerotinia sclerotiorum (strain ATCC 18683 / 1980 / Ss-1) TaxID=665079 RepID=A7ELV5_SCLS1|nr:predicted protein [Sclerotinia sclerotiorum 1980 UF-70]EDO03821.1 predicted protein [Sclerotinia sclerotiorum 1980 UF-70]
MNGPAQRFLQFRKNSGDDSGKKNGDKGLVNLNGCYPSFAKYPTWNEYQERICRDLA